MSFNTIALHSFPLVIPVLRSEYPEPFWPRHRRASMMPHGTNSQARHNMLGIPRLDATRPHAFSQGCACLWNDPEVQNDWALAAKRPSTGGAGFLQGKRAQSHGQRAHKHKGQKHVSFAKDPERDGRPSVDRVRGRRASVDRMRDRHAPVDREQKRRASTDRGYGPRSSGEHKHSHASAGHHHKYESVPSRMVRPPVSAVSFKPPTQSHHPHRPSFEYVPVHDCPHSPQYPIYILPPPAPAPQIHLPSQRRDRIPVDANRRVSFPNTNVLPSEGSTNPSGLARFNPFNKLRTMSIFTSQKKLAPESPRIHSNRLCRKSIAGGA